MHKIIPHINFQLDWLHLASGITLINLFAELDYICGGRKLDIGILGFNFYLWWNASTPESTELLDSLEAMREDAIEHPERLVPHDLSMPEDRKVQWRFDWSEDWSQWLDLFRGRKHNWDNFTFVNLYWGNRFEHTAGLLGLNASLWKY